MTQQQKKIVVIGCLDTKAEAFDFLRKCILNCGEKVITINTGVFGSTDFFPIDFEAVDVASHAGAQLTDLRERRDRGQAMDVMGAGAAHILRTLIDEDQVKAVIGMGGGGGTYLTLAAMQPVPLGIPKLCVSTLATKDLSRQIGHKDIVLVPSVVDVAGLNSILKVIISQAANAICAMAAAAQDAAAQDAGFLGNKNIAISMFGNTTACVDRCTELLRAEGYEVLAFHANGTGGKAMEALIREGCFEAVIDVTTTELADDLCDGICSAGPDRLTAATETGIPQIVVPGCMDMVNFGHLDTIPEHYQNRQLYSWAPDVTLMRTNVEENIELGKRLAEKLNAASANVAIMLPEKGVSQSDSEGGRFYDPEADAALFLAIRDNAGKNIEVISCNLHINDARFADELVAKLLQMLK